MNEMEFKQTFQYRNVDEATCRNCKYSLLDSYGCLADIDSEKFRVCRNPKLNDIHYGIGVYKLCVCNLWEKNNE